MDIDLSRLQTPELIVMVIVGLLLLFMGYRIKRVAFFIVWFLIGFNLMGILMPELNKLVPAIAENGLWQTLLPIAGGLLLALLGFTIEKICVGGIVFGLALMITSQYFGTDLQTLVVGAVVGIVLAGIAVMMIKPAIIIATALAGSYSLAMAILTLATELDAGAFYFPLLVGLAAIGVLVQFATTRHL